MKVITRTNNQSAREAASFIIDTVANAPWLSDIEQDDSSGEACEFEPEVAHELKVLLLEKIGAEVWLYDFIEDLNIPSQVWNALNGVNEWEAEAATNCKALMYGLKNKHFALASQAAKSLGAQITVQLLKGNIEAPSIVSKGLKNCKIGKPFRPQAGRQPSTGEAIRVVITFYYLKLIGIDKPTQTQVRKELSKHKISSGTISKIFSKIGLKTMAGDGRNANKYRSSKRKTSIQKLIRKQSIGL